MKNLITRWGKKLNNSMPLNDYPRPQLRRSNWDCLNGLWEYAIKPAGAGDKLPETWDGEIVVPFSPESPLSGVNRLLMPNESLFYRRQFNLPLLPDNHRRLLHFGAVDQKCTVFIDGIKIGEHEGGYLPFSFDITDAVIGKGSFTLAVRVTDASDTGTEAYGKQKIQRGGIWYTPQSGIWQTVWSEVVPNSYINSLTICPDFDGSRVHIELETTGTYTGASVEILEGEKIIAELESHEKSFSLSLKEFKAWSPDSPFLYGLKIAAGEDSVESYFGMRSFGIVEDKKGFKRIALNGKPIFQSGLLDQGYWSDGLYTPPSDEAMVWEITELKKMGFNMLRKHIKVEPLRWYYHCDRLGMLVWQDFVSGGGPYKAMNIQVLPFLNIHRKDSNYKFFGRENPDGRKAFRRDMYDTVALLKNTVSLCAWVPFNEGWGQFDSAEITQELRKLDPTRLIDHASGWHDQGAGDFCSKHIYYKPYHLKPDKHERIHALTEFGGYSCPTEGHMASEKLFGYKMYHSKEDLGKAILSLYEKEVIPASSKGLSACIYTQVSDVEDEINGVFTYDREAIKVEPEIFIEINRKLIEGMCTDERT